MSSQYDAYWRSCLNQLAEILKLARLQGEACLDCEEIAPYGERDTWAGRVVVNASGEILAGEMAHMKSLGRLLSQNASLLADGARYVLRMNNKRQLTVRLEGAQMLPVEHNSKLAINTTTASNETPNCVKCHQLAWQLPRHRHPIDWSTLPANGIYLLFETGEQAHGMDRIVYVGTHEIDGGLPERVRNHFTGSRSNSTVRKHVGEALIRRKGLSQSSVDAWLDEQPEANYLESALNGYLERAFSLAVISVTGDRSTREDMEKDWIHALSSCPTCGAADQWLGLHSSFPSIHKGQLWNSHHVRSRPVSTTAAQEIPSCFRPLIILPCSGDKDLTRIPVFRPQDYVSLTALLPQSGAGLAAARVRIGVSHVEASSSQQTALDYYQGNLYKTPNLKPTIACQQRQGKAAFMIISGAYGLVLPNEPIQNYDHRLEYNEWKNAGLEAVIGEYLQVMSIDFVIGFLSRTTAYAKLLCTIFAACQLPSHLTAGYIFPEWPGGGGAQKRVPSVLGQACLKYLDSGFDLSVLLATPIDGLVMRWVKLR